ncbi:sigma-70 family RNA polymerase sigma factor [Amycolatopsis suaedae]|uniref:sigma-70 family RNA polymerase sigma factor n=1 Tax=Amycolatopsis suaedae TaxID=2510978 RepID=UPI00196B7847|nr:sigma-70 family RNA polymerase sigma factor [Amycolatopsis suaedae]
MTDLLTGSFEEHRPHLRGVAYRILGSLAEADDAVQEAWLRASRADLAAVRNIGGWLTTVVGRVCLNMLRSRREEPADVPDREGGADPAEEAELADSVGLAMLVVLDTLQPAERLAFVLHDMFAVPFEEIAPLVERTPDATRQLASRARRRVRGGEPVPDLARQREVVGAYLAAARDGDFDALVAVLAPDVVLTAGPVVRRGAHEVGKGAILASQRARFTGVALIDGTVGLVKASRGRLELALLFRVDGDRVTEIDVVTEQERLAELEIAVLD